MPKLIAKLCNQLNTSKKKFSKNLNLGDAGDKKEKNSTKMEVKQTSQKLEVDNKKRNDIFNIVGNEHTKKKTKKEKDYEINEIRRLAEIEFVDDPSVPPLMWNYSTGLDLYTNFLNESSHIEVIWKSYARPGKNWGRYHLLMEHFLPCWKVRVIIVVSEKIR